MNILRFDVNMAVINAVSLMNFNNGNLKHRNEEKCAKKTTTHHSIQDLVSKENGTSLVNGSAFSSPSKSNFVIT